MSPLPPRLPKSYSYRHVTYVFPLQGSPCHVGDEVKENVSVMKGHRSSGKYTYPQSHTAVTRQQHVFLTEADPQSWGRTLRILGILKEKNYKYKIRCGALEEANASEDIRKF